jgi:hypothetical protein
MQLTRRANFLGFYYRGNGRENYISNSTLVRQKFNNLFKSTGQEPFTDNTTTVVLAD